MKLPQISIIIPVFNAERSLERCLKSAIAQTLSDIEIIVVDDGSSDKSMSILKRYAQEDSRVRVVGLFKNSGVSAARNLGIYLARGEYIGFIDADDYVDTDFYEKLYVKALGGQADVVCGNVRVRQFNGREETFDKFLLDVNFSKFSFICAMWIAIYKTSFIKRNNIYTPIGIDSAEDSLFSMQCACLANKIDTVFGTYYHYIRTEGSLNSPVLSEKKMHGRVLAFKKTINFVNNFGLDEDSYNRALGPFFRTIYIDAFVRNSKREVRLFLLNAGIEAFTKYKHKSFLRGKYPTICRFLESEDVEGLYDYLDIESKKETKRIKNNIMLFGTIRIGKIVKEPEKGKKTLYFLGIPIVAWGIPVVTKEF